MKQATANDILRVVDMAARFHAVHKPDWPFDRDDAAAFFRGLIDSPNGLLLVTDGGFAAAVASTNPFCSEWLTVSQLLMWAEDNSGGALWRGMRAWAKEIGASEFRFSCHPHNARVSRFMSRRGKPDEMIYTEALTCV